MAKMTMEKAKIKQHPNLYEEAIRKHGQYIRWYSSIPCWCIGEGGRPNPGCKICRGRGNRYYPVPAVRRVDMGLGGGGFELNVKEIIKSINKIYSGANESISYSSFSGKVVILPEKLKEGRYYYVDYEEDLEVGYSGICTYEGRGIIRVPIVGYSNIYGDFKGELIEITSPIVNKTRSDEPMNVIAFWEDLILTDSYAEEADELTIVCKYVKPLKFLVADIKSKIKYEMSKVGIAADMQATFSGYYRVGSGDMITLLKAEQKASIVGNASGDFYSLPFFHVNSIVRIEDAEGEIADAVIVRNNEIKWGARKPKDKFSISLMFNPSFVILDDLPSLRYAEDKVFPKKVLLKRWDLQSRGSKRPGFPHSSGMEDLTY